MGKPVLSYLYVLKVTAYATADVIRKHSLQYIKNVCVEWHARILRKDCAMLVSDV